MERVTPTESVNTLSLYSTLTRPVRGPGLWSVSPPQSQSTLSLSLSTLTRPVRGPGLWSVSPPQSQSTLSLSTPLSHDQ